MNGPTDAPFIRLKPCIDSASHAFVGSRPPEGDFGYLVIFCKRCGMTQHELRA